jgi:ureidoglycolate hydrolase
MIAIEFITPERFAPFGMVMHHKSGPVGYEPLVTVQSTGWIWAIYTVDQRQATELECHPNTPESFEPLAGVGVLLVAPPDDPTLVRAFLLDQPVLLHPGVWHTLVALSERCTTKIVENSVVDTEFYRFPKSLSLGFF